MVMQGPPTLPDDAPAELKRAQGIIQASISELIQIAGQIALWRAIGSDQALHARLGASDVGAATATVFYALQNSVVLGLARMFDDEALHVGQAFNLILKPDNAAWLLAQHKARIRGGGMMMVPRDGGRQADQEDMGHRILEWSAKVAGQDFEARHAAFKQARKAFNSSDANEALRRLKEMRHKEVAHNDLDAAWRTDRPKLGDLRLVFDAARRLVWDANYLCLGSDHNDLWDVEPFEVRARCLTAVLRPEGHAELEAARAAAAGAQPST